MIQIADNQKKILIQLAKINPRVVLQSDQLIFHDDAMTIMAFYKWDSKVRKPFAVHNLRDFITLLSKYTDPVIEEGETEITIRDGGGKFSSTYAHAMHMSAEEYMRQGDNNKLPVAFSSTDNLISTQVKDQDKFLSLKRDDIENITDHASVLEDVKYLITEGNTIQLSAHDLNNPSQNRFSITLDGDADMPRESFNPEDFKNLVKEFDYEMRATSSGVYLKSTDGTLSYFISAYASPNS